MLRSNPGQDFYLLKTAMPIFGTVPAADGLSVDKMIEHDKKDINESAKAANVVTQDGDQSSFHEDHLSIAIDSLPSHVDPVGDSESEGGYDLDHQTPEMRKKFMEHLQKEHLLLLHQAAMSIASVDPNFNEELPGNAERVGRLLRI